MEQKIDEFKKFVVKLFTTAYAAWKSEQLVCDCCKCQKCGHKYKLDLIIPDEIWRKITPSKNNEGGLLCPICIITEIEKIYGYSMFKLSEGNQELLKISTKNYGEDGIGLSSEEISKLL